MEARARPDLPTIREALRDLQRFELVLPAAEIAEDVVERDAPAEQSPGGDRGIEAAREQADRAALGSEREAAGAGGARDEVVGAIGIDFDEDGGLRVP